jgi:hypothetical protein
MNTANYFPLLTHHYASPKSLNIRMRDGLIGYAIYLIMFQKLAATKTRRIKLDQVEELAFELHLDQTKINLKEFIMRHFEVIGDEFCSQELNDSLAWYDSKYAKSSEGGKKAAENMTEEQRKQRSHNANNEKKKKQELQNVENTLENGIPNPLGDTKETYLTPLGEEPNNKIKKNIIEKNIIETETNETEEIGTNRSEDKKTEENETDSGLFFNLSEVQKSVESYQSLPSKFFFGENINVVINSYYEFYKNYPNEKISVAEFERILYYTLLQQTMSINVDNLNKYISTNPITVQAFNILDTCKLINKNPKVNEDFLNEINEVIPQPI